MKIVETTTKHLEYYVNLVNEAEAEPESIDSNFERSSNESKMLSSSAGCYGEIVHEGTSQSMWQASLLSYFKKPSQPSAPITLIGQQPTILRQESPQAKKTTIC